MSFHRDSFRGAVGRAAVRIGLACGLAACAGACGGGASRGKPGGAGGQHGSRAAAREDGASNFVVRVDGRALTQADLDRMAEVVAHAQGVDRMPAGEAAAARARIENNLTEMFVAENVLTKEAIRLGVRVPDAAIDGEIARIRSNLPRGDTFEDFLRKFRLTMDQLRDNIRREYVIRQLLAQAVAPPPRPTDAEIAEVYARETGRFAAPAQVRARHILVRCDDAMPAAEQEARRQRVEEYRRQLLAGTNFAALAAARSEDPQSAVMGGELPPFGRGEMVPEFEAAAFAQATNEVGPPVRTRYGYHIVQVAERTAARTNTLEQARPRILAMMEQRKREELFSAYVERLKAASRIEYGR